MAVFGRAMAEEMEAMAIASDVDDDVDEEDGRFFSFIGGAAGTW